MHGMCKCLLCETNCFSQPLTAKHMKTTHTAIYSMYGMCHIFCYRTYQCILCEKNCFLEPFPAKHSKTAHATRYKLSMNFLWQNIWNNHVCIHKIFYKCMEIMRLNKMWTNFFKGNILLSHMESTQEQYYNSPCHVRG